MTRKSKQHIVPQTYLRNFCDSRLPNGWPEGRPFTPSLWVHPRGLDAPPRRSAPRNVAWVRDVYTMRDDDPDHPWPEEALGRLETSFAATLDHVTSGEELSDTDRAIIALFVGALHERTVGMLNQRQAFFDDLAHLTRQFEDARSDPKTSAARDAFWKRFGEEAKRQVANSATAFAQVTGLHAFILENASRMAFTTSDSPATCRQIHADELIEIGMPEEWLFAGIPRGARGFFVYCPLTPHHAYVASTFFPPNPEMLRRRAESIQLIYALNEFTRDSADEQLFTSTENPYGPLLPFAQARDRRIAAARQNPESGLLVHSERERYWLPTTSVSHGTGDHVLTARLTFTTGDMVTLRAMADDNNFREIIVVDHGEERGGMRDAGFVTVAVTDDASSVIENGPLRMR
jgi:hypothetical protein